MNIPVWFCSLLLLGATGLAWAAPADDYEKSLLNEAAETTLKGEKLHATEIEPAVTPAPDTDVQALSESVARSLEKALSDKHDAATIKQEMGSMVAGALGQGMNLDDIRAAVQTAMSGMRSEDGTESEQALESVHKVLDDVIEANRKLIEDPGDDAVALNNEIRDVVASSTSALAAQKPAPSVVETEEKIAGEWRHIVNKGESLSLIARQYYKDGLKYWKIYQANQELLSNPDIILVGQELKIPE